MDTIKVGGVGGGGTIGEAVVARRRRSYSSEEKQRLVAESYEPGTSVALVARRHAINANLLFTWRRQMRGPAAAPEGLGLIPIEVLSDAACPEPAPTAPADRHGEMEIILVGGARAGGRWGQRAGAKAGAVSPEGGVMMTPGTGVRVYLATRPCDMRKGLDGLAAQVQNVLAADPFSGSLFVFRGKRGDILKILAWDGSGLCLFSKRLEQGRFVWPPIVDGRLQLTPAQLALLIEGIDWRRTVAPEPVTRPEAV